MARQKVLVPVELARQFQSKERYLTIRYREAICMSLLDSRSYRKGCSSFNTQREREGTEALSFNTYANDIINEGQALIAAKHSMTEIILKQYGFNAETGQYTGKELPVGMQNHRPTTITVDPDKILSKMLPDWDPENPELEDEPDQAGYSEPDTSEVLFRKKPRKKGREAVSPEQIPSTCENYIKWRNTQQGIYKLCKILHEWELETNPSEIVYIMVDAVYTDEQAEKHVPGGKTYKEKPGRNVHWNARIEWDISKKYIITDENIDWMFKQIIAFLLVNKLIDRFFIFFTDGETQIFDKISIYFKDLDHESYLDYVHIQKKCYEKLSMGIKSKRVADPRGEKIYYQKGKKKGQLKEQTMTSLSILYCRRLTSMLWAGNREEAIQYIENIDPEVIANQEQLNSLISYLSLENGKGQYITCYALRRRLGLRNSSNGSECANYQIVTSAQKEGNKCYRSKGSHSAAAITALSVNGEWDQWFEHNAFTFEYKYSCQTGQEIGSTPPESV